MEFPQSKINLAIAGFFFLGLFVLAIGGGLFFFGSADSSEDDIQIIAGDSDTGSEKGIVVHVDGAVVSPGVYQLTPNVRINDAIAAAGGLTADADQSRINLAAKVADGQKVRVPRVGEGTTSTTGGSIAGESVSGLININTASESELDKLPGVGPVTAGKIIASRPYSTPEELLGKKVVSRSVFEKIRDLITVY